MQRRCSAQYMQTMCNWHVKEKKRARFASKEKNSQVPVPPLVSTSILDAECGSKNNKWTSRIFGRRVIVQWDDGPYEGRVNAYSEERRCFHIHYDDGDTEWIEIPHKDVSFVSPRSHDI